MSSFDHVGQIVNHGYIVYLDFRLCSMLFKGCGKFPHSLEGIGEDVVFRHGEKSLFPRELEIAVLGEQGV